MNSIPVGAKINRVCYVTFTYLICKYKWGKKVFQKVWLCRIGKLQADTCILNPTSGKAVRQSHRFATPSKHVSSPTHWLSGWIMHLPVCLTQSKQVLGTCQESKVEHLSDVLMCLRALILLPDWYQNTHPSTHRECVSWGSICLAFPSCSPIPEPLQISSRPLQPIRCNH